MATIARRLNNLKIQATLVSRLCTNMPSSGETAAASASVQYDLGKATPSPPSEPVGPGASKTGDYKNAEYYCYNETSFFDFEIDMAKDRIEQPGADNGLL
ncbi:NADH:ubiquinone oxidoreductase subunit V3 [Oratosquilla oratoria]|uniref:NADH:ubiquinone oxidoreductase subunit V3 n=1 Tax=Oratosquilla oratoria TaxID=337810 RepID=UPI003F75F63F